MTFKFANSKFSLLHLLILALTISACQQDTNFASSKLAVSRKIAASKDDDATLKMLSLNIQPETSTLKVGESANFKAFLVKVGVAPEDITESVEWSLDNLSLGVLGDSVKGQFVTKADGTGTISAKMNDLTATAQLTVEVLPVVDFTLKISPDAQALAKTNSSQLVLTANYANGEVSNVTSKATWVASGPDIATVSDETATKGLVYAIKAGTTSITASFEGKSISAKVDVDPDPIKTIEPGQQVGKKVLVCISYDKVKIGGHKCDRAKFDLFLAGKMAGQFNLNNSGTGASVEGGIFTSAWDSSGRFKLNTKCAGTTCHGDVAILSIIGEVIDQYGIQKWVKIEQGRISPITEYSYKFVDFTLSDKEITFGPLCTIK